LAEKCMKLLSLDIKEKPFQKTHIQLCWIFSRSVFSVTHKDQV
jgi:hypothetical protein